MYSHVALKLFNMQKKRANNYGIISTLILLVLIVFYLNSIKTKEVSDSGSRQTFSSEAQPITNKSAETIVAKPELSELSAEEIEVQPEQSKTNDHTRLSPEEGISLRGDTIHYLEGETKGAFNDMRKYKVEHLKPKKESDEGL